MEDMENIWKKMWLKNVAIRIFHTIFYTIGVNSKNNLTDSINNPVKWEYFLGPAVHKC